MGTNTFIFRWNCIYTHQQKVQCLKSDPIGDNNLQMLEGDIEEWRKF